MATTHHVRLFQGNNGDVIERSMNDRLKSNRECQFIKIINVDTPTAWSVLATLSVVVVDLTIIGPFLFSFMKIIRLNVSDDLYYHKYATKFAYSHCIKLRLRLYHDLKYYPYVEHMITTLTLNLLHSMFFLP